MDVSRHMSTLALGPSQEVVGEKDTSPVVLCVDRGNRIFWVIYNSLDFDFRDHQVAQYLSLIHI